MQEDIERIRWIELRFGITKTVNYGLSNDKVQSIEGELFSMLGRYKESLNIKNAVPKVRIWITNNKLNFLFFDRKTGKRVLLGDWLSNKEITYDD